MKTPASDPTAPLLLERQGAIATLRLNRPDALNAINVPMAQALLAAVQTIGADPSGYRRDYLDLLKNAAVLAP